MEIVVEWLEELARAKINIWACEGRIPCDKEDQITGPLGRWSSLKSCESASVPYVSPLPAALISVSAEILMHRPDFHSAFDKTCFCLYQFCSSSDLRKNQDTTHFICSRRHESIMMTLAMIWAEEGGGMTGLV